MARQIVDRNTGEVLEEPPFVKIYIERLCQVKGLKSGHRKILDFMLNNMNWENMVSYGSTTKKRFLEANEIKNQTFNNYVSGLINAKLIRRTGRGEFMVNPKYAAKVDWHKVQRIRWTMDFSDDGMEDRVVFEGSVRDSAIDEIRPHFEPKREEDHQPFEQTALPPKTAPKPKAKKPTHTPEELELFEYWKMRMGKSNNAKLNGKREANLKARLKDGYDVDYIKKAIDGCASSPMHMGQNDQGTVYDDLELICRDPTRLEKFAESVGKLAPKSNVETIDDFKRKNAEQCARIRASGILDDIL